MMLFGLFLLLGLGHPPVMAAVVDHAEQPLLISDLDAAVEAAAPCVRDVGTMEMLRQVNEREWTKKGLWPSDHRLCDQLMPL